MADPNGFPDGVALTELGLSREVIADSIAGTYKLLDRIDATLREDDVGPLCQIVELANLSSMIGNILGAEIAKNSNGVLKRNGAHKYPDLIPFDEGSGQKGIEIKVALNNNQPKGHLAKAGSYITCRYVLLDAEGAVINERADRERALQPCIWEVRAGRLAEEHFNVSNTAGDSGKTAVINSEGMRQLSVVYVDLKALPGHQVGRRASQYAALLKGEPQFLPTTSVDRPRIRGGSGPRRERP